MRAIRQKDLMMTEIVYQSKEDLFPKFGSASRDKKSACVREDLPTCARDFVALHELYHLRDRSTWWIWREIKANAHGALHRPIGFLVCMVMSLQPYRLKYYWGRLIGIEK
jgi:hypothetical protein